MRRELSAEVGSTCACPDGVFGFGFFQSTGGKALVGLVSRAGVPVCHRPVLHITLCSPVLGEDVDNCLDLHHEENSIFCIVG